MLKYKNNKFRIMQIADVQDTQFTSPDTLRFISAAIDKEKPDLVIFTGDQVKSYGFSTFIGNRNNNIDKTIKNILAPLVQRNTPFAFVYGNHDVPKGYSYNHQTGVYESYNNCVHNQCFDRLNRTDCMCLPIYNESGKKINLAIYLIDNYHKRNGSNGASDEMNQWCVNVNNRLKEKNSNMHAIVFEHIPVYEMYEMLEYHDKPIDGSIEGNWTHKGQYFTLPKENLFQSEFMKESVACPASDGSFDTWLEMGNVDAAFFGHDHNNCFKGNVRGITLGYTPGAGFNVYGPGLDRAVRIIDYFEDKPFNTYTVTYKSICGSKLSLPVRHFFYNYAPSSKDAAKKMAVKALPYFAGAIALSTLSLKIKKKTK